MVFNGILSILFIIMAICAAIFYMGKDNFSISIHPKDGLRDKMTNIKATPKKEDFSKRGDDLLRKNRDVKRKKLLSLDRQKSSGKFNVK